MGIFHFREPEFPNIPENLHVGIDVDRSPLKIAELGDLKTLKRKWRPWLIAEGAWSGMRGCDFVKRSDLDRDARSSTNRKLKDLASELLFRRRTDENSDGNLAIRRPKVQVMSERGPRELGKLGIEGRLAIAE